MTPLYAGFNLTPIWDLNLATGYLFEAPYHKVYIEHHSVCPLVGIGTPTTPLPQACVPPPPPPPEGHTRLWLNGWRRPNSDDWRKSFAIWLLCAPYPSRFSLGVGKHVGSESGHIQSEKLQNMVFKAPPPPTPSQPHTVCIYSTYFDTGGVGNWK